MGGLHSFVWGKNSSFGASAFRAVISYRSVRGSVHSSHRCSLLPIIISWATSELSDGKLSVFDILMNKSDKEGSPMCVLNCFNIGAINLNTL